MSDENAIVPGTIFHWKGFKFPDGATADKFLVIVGCQNGKNYLAIVATSKQKKRSTQPGGNPQDGYYHILIKRNVCKLLEDKLAQDGFEVLNKGTVIPFPMYHWKRIFSR
jgi:hypothetical protein